MGSLLNRAVLECSEDEKFHHCESSCVDGKQAPYFPVSINGLKTLKGLRHSEKCVTGSRGITGRTMRVVFCRVWWVLWKYRIFPRDGMHFKAEGFSEVLRA